MKAAVVFPKAAKRLGVRYLGMKRSYMNYLHGYFEDKEGNIVRCFYFPSIKSVAETVQANLDECRYQENPDAIRAYFDGLSC